jgi:hypothetical protein
MLTPYETEPACQLYACKMEVAMNRENTLKKYYAISAIIVGIAGTLLHFLYEWCNYSPIIGLIAPVNESAWEHMKLIFFPMLAVSLILRRLPALRQSGTFAPLCLGNLIGTWMIPTLFYAYMAITSRDIFWLDIAIFIISIAAAFTIAYAAGTGRAEKTTLALSVPIYVLTIMMALCFFAASPRIFSSAPAQSPQNQGACISGTPQSQDLSGA